MTMKTMTRWKGWGVAALAAVAVAGCDDGLTEINVNPNDPVNVGAEYLFPNAVEAAVSRVTGSSLNMDLTGLWVQHYVEHEYSSEDRYEVSSSAISSHWASFYAGPLQDLQEVIEKGQANDRPNVTAMGMVMKAWTAQVVTDLWGDVGYSQALRGRDASAGLTVEYDSQQAIYNALLDEAERAAAMVEPDGIAMGSADIIYGSDMEKWQRFANSLRMRLAMRLSEVDPTLAASEFAAAYTAGGFDSNDDSAILWYVDNGLNRHPIHVYELSRDDHSVSATMIDTLQSMNDPRLAVYAKPNAAGEYWGNPNGVMIDPAPLDSVSRIGEFYSRADAPSILMSYAEVLLLQAEAAERGWITASAEDLYTSAIRASMEFNGVAAAEIDAYLAQPEVQYAGGAEGLRQIALQKWIVLFGNGPEAYAEWRRTGVPELEPAENALNEGLIPVRLFYPASEESLNAAALSAAIARQGGATLNDRIWWDVD